MPVEYSAPAIEDRAKEVLLAAGTGTPRSTSSLSIPDLLIAATAEINNHSVLHLNKDLELIAGLTSQSAERLTK